MDRMISSLLPEALLVGQPEVDAQHEEIFVRIESLKALCVDSDALPLARFDDLLVLFAEHFATEERIARAAGLEFSQHARTHRANLQVIARALAEVRQGVRDVHSFLRYVEFWFERHIVQDDQPFAASLRPLVMKGEAPPPEAAGVG